MGKTITLKGPSAKAFVDAKMGKSAKTDEERIERVLMSLELALKGGERRGAALIVQHLVRDGLEATADALTELPGNLITRGTAATKKRQ